MIGNRIAIALSAALFLVLAGTGAGNAFWSSQATTSANVAAGSIGISQSGFASLAVVYSSAVTVATAPVTVTNSGSVTAPYGLTLGASSATPLATSVTVNTWAVASAASCVAGSTTPGSATSSNWTGVPAITGTLAPTASAIVCVRTTLDSVTAASIGSVTATLDLTSTLGSWTAATTATAAQSAIDTVAPGAPGTPTASPIDGAQPTLSWTPATDLVGVTAYLVYRDGTLVGTVTTATYPEPGLNPSTAYRYTISARDAAGNVSVPSGITTVTTTAAPSPTLWYQVRNPSSGMCVEGLGSTNATPLVINTCSSATNQAWRFVELTTNVYKVVARYVPTLDFVWEISSATGGGRNNNAPAQLSTYLAGSNQQWILTSPLAGTYKFENVNGSKCLEAPNIAAGTQLVQSSCKAVATQTFTLSVVP